MPSFRAVKPPKPIEIKKFLGINESVGETEVKLGEATSQINFRLTQDYKPQKRLGHNTFIDCENLLAIQGMWFGTIGSKQVIIFLNDGKVYEFDAIAPTENILLSELILEGVVTQIGTMTDAKTNIFYFNSKLYFQNGVEYKQYDGTTFQDTVAYIPTIYVATAPDGSAKELFENSNLLTGEKKQEFVSDGVATEYFIAETNIDADVTTCTIDGIIKVEGVDYTVDRVLGKFIFGVAPVASAIVIPQWTKVTAGSLDLVLKNKASVLFGLSNDTSVFMWGNPDQGNRRMWSGTLDAGYFPVFNFTNVGSNEFAITDIVKQYDRQIIFKENETFYSFAEFISLTGKYDYPVKPLNSSVGNVAFHQVQLIDNSPLSLKSQSWWRWNNTQVLDERNSENISERFRDSFEEIQMINAITFDNQDQKEYWCNIADKVYIWNYGNDTMYIYDNVKANKFLNVEGVVVFGGNGVIEKFEGLNDNEIAVNAELTLAFNDFNSFEFRKNSRQVFIALKPESLTSIDVAYKTNKLNEFKTISKVLNYILLDFNLIDFNAFSFKTNRNPQTFRRKIRAKKYTNIQFKFSNNKLNEACTLLGFKVSAETNGLER